MANYSEADIAKIINDCEILILPDNSTIEDVLVDENQQILITNCSGGIQSSYSDPQIEQTDEEFEQIFQQSKLNKHRHPDPKPTDFSHLQHIPSTSSEETPNSERALQINKVLRERLVQFRSKILKLIEKIDAQFRVNNIFLEQAKSNDGKDATNFKSTYIRCGAPFFKDALGFPAPFNEDYKMRKEAGVEFFPFDLPPSNSRWKTKEKVALVKGVKNQMINYIKSAQSRQVCEDTRKTRGKISKLKFISNNKDLEESPIIDIYESIQRSYPDFAINWNLISFDDLQSTHSVSECMGMWYSYLRPDLNRDEFSNEECMIIANAMCENDFSDWNELAARLNNRSSLQSFVHYHATFARLCPANVRWTDEEDALLIEATETHSSNGIINWMKVGSVIPTRSKSQCYNRYMVLMKAQGKKKGVFSRKEDRLILDYVKKMGEKSFNKIPETFLPGRTSIQIKNHYNNALKHKGTVHPWTREEDKQLMEFVEKEGTNNWFKIASILGTHSRISCRTRFVTISKFLSKNPDASLKDVPCKTKSVTAVQRAESYSDVEDDEDEEEKLKRVTNFGTKTFNNFKERHEYMYKFMRTSFNYDFKPREVNTDDLKLKVMMFLLSVGDCRIILNRRSFMFTDRQLTAINSAVAYELNQKLFRELKFATQHTQFLTPPSYCTAVGLRAITIKLAEDEPEEENTVENPSMKYNLALENFQKLYFSLFYWTAMLAKIDKDALSTIHFMKYPRTDMSTREIFQEIRKRGNTSYSNRPFEVNSDKKRVYPSAKKPRID